VPISPTCLSQCSSAAVGLYTAALALPYLKIL